MKNTELPSEKTTKQKQPEKSNDLFIVSIIFIIIFISMIAYKYVSGSSFSIAFAVGSVILPSLMLSVIPYYIYKGIVVFMRELK